MPETRTHCVRIPDWTWAVIEERAAKAHTTPSHLVRLALDDWARRGHEDPRL